MSILEQVKAEIELHEKHYHVEDDIVSYLVGPKFANITTFKEKAGLMTLILRKGENGQQQILRAVGNSESLETFDIIYETHLSLYEQYKINK